MNRICEKCGKEKDKHICTHVKKETFNKTKIDEIGGSKREQIKTKFDGKDTF